MRRTFRPRLFQEDFTTIIPWKLSRNLTRGRARLCYGCLLVFRPVGIPAGVCRVLLALSLTFSCVSANCQTIGAYGRDFANSLWPPGGTLTTPAASAAWSNYVSKPTGFGSGAEAYGYHYGVALADNVNGKFMRKFVFAAAARKPEGYVAVETGGGWKGIGKGIGIAAVHWLFVIPQASAKSFNWSGLPASFASAALSNVYQPAQQRSWSATFARFGTNCAGYAGGDVWIQVTHDWQTHRVFHYLLKNR